MTVEITSARSEDVDFRPYLKEISARLKRNWHLFAPESALDKEKGTVTVRFHIQRDGTILPDEPILVAGSGNEALDNAALEAIRKSVPFDHLPVTFDGLMIRLRCIFKSGVGSDP